MKVLYFSDAGPQLSVFASQVLGMINAWRKVADVDLVYRQKGGGDDTVDGRPLRQVGSFSRLLLRREVALNRLSDLIRDYDLIHCRGALTTWMAHQARRHIQNKKPRVLFDCRGLLVEEMGMSLGRLFCEPLSPVRYFEYRVIEKHAVLHCDLFTTVSREMSEHFKQKYGRAADRVIPCIVNDSAFIFDPERRDEIRNRLHLGQERVFLYVGGVDPWQRLDILGRWWTGHTKRYQQDILLILTGDKNAFLRALQMENDNAATRIRFDFVPHRDVPAYMFAADFGIMFRDETIVNRVSCPVKLGEYLATGLAVLSNQSYLTARDPENIMLVNPEQGIPEDTKIKTLRRRMADSERIAKIYSGEKAVRNILDML
ncbi:MAG: glycosyltransferase [candidate division Zixibacteria bacterium]|nr:glycosyltransferase [candidate division Zixibacteria bacterium]